MDRTAGCATLLHEGRKFRKFSDTELFSVSTKPDTRGVWPGATDHRLSFRLAWHQQPWSSISSTTVVTLRHTVTSHPTLSSFSRPTNNYSPRPLTSSTPFSLPVVSVAFLALQTDLDDGRKHPLLPTVPARSSPEPLWQYGSRIHGTR